MTKGFSVPGPTIVFAWPTKEDFDLLAVLENLHDWKPCRTTTLIHADDQEWERRCHIKKVEGSGVMVIFQWFDERPIGTRNPPESQP